jgi:hypothetical protein
MAMSDNTLSPVILQGGKMEAGGWGTTALGLSWDAPLLIHLFSE